MQGRVLTAAIAAFISAICPASADGEAFSLLGKHRDWYFVDRAGVGHFGHAIVAKELQPRLEAFRDKLIEIDVTKTAQVARPGMVTLKAFASVEALPPPPISIRLWSRPSDDQPDSMDVYCTITKSSDFPAGDDRSCPHIEVWWGYYPEIEPLDDDGSKRRLAEFHGEYYFVMNSPALGIPGAQGHRAAPIGPGESMTYLLEKPLALTGECDVGVRVKFEREGGSPIVGEARIPIDLPIGATPAVKQRSTLRAKTRLRVEGEWLAVDGRLFAEGPTPKSLALRRGQNNNVAVGGPRAFDETGQEIPCKHTWHDGNLPLGFQVDDSYRPAQIDERGLPFHFLVRWDDGFARPAAKCLKLTVLTEDGLETVSLSDALPEFPPLEKVGLGDVAGGCLVRIRVERSHREVEREPWTLHFEVICEDGSSDFLWTTPGGSSILLDGLTVGELSSRSIWNLPYRSVQPFRESAGLAPGKHTVLLVVHSDRQRGGWFDSTVRPHRVFHGTLTSKEAEFLVEPEAVR